MLHSQTYDTLTLDNERVIVFKRTPTIGYAVTQSTENVKAFKVWTDQYVTPPKLTVVGGIDTIDEVKSFSLAGEIARGILKTMEVMEHSSVGL